MERKNPPRDYPLGHAKLQRQRDVSDVPSSQSIVNNNIWAPTPVVAFLALKKNRSLTPPANQQSTTMATDALAAGRHKNRRKMVPFGKEKATSSLSIHTICKKGTKRRQHSQRIEY